MPSVMHSRHLILAAALSGALTLTGCQAAEGERPDQGRPTPSEPLPEETPAEVETPEGAPELQFVDATIGGPRDGDPLWQLLEEAAGAGDEVYLHATMHNYQPPAEGDGTLTLTSGAPDSVSITVDESQVTAFNDVFYQITGTFEVEQLASAAFVLSTVDGEEIEELTPQTPSDEERCTQDRAEDRVNGAVYQLVDEPDTREELRLTWAGSPAVWWAIQATADALSSSEGDLATDALAEACAPYLE